MEEIYDTNDSFNFSKLVLTKPSLISGGNYFIRCLMNGSPLYIQLPKCSTKQGILKAGKRFYTDLMFTNENESFIRWMENLENHCQRIIYENRAKWFENDMELHDIENYFTSPLKLFKSGKYYSSRVNIHTVLGKPSIKIYDENELEVNYETINDKMTVVTIIEIQGIKCSAKSFQIELELKQMMVLKPVNLFEKCIIAPVRSKPEHVPIITEELPVIEPFVEGEEDTPLEQTEKVLPEVKEEVLPAMKDEVLPAMKDEVLPVMKEEILPVKDEPTNGMQEIEFHLDELPMDETVTIKQRDNVYYKMYKEAKQKAKKARDLALASYLEAKRIKNTYMLNSGSDSDSDEDQEEDEEEDQDDEDGNGKEETDEKLPII